METHAEKIIFNIFWDITKTYEVVMMLDTDHYRRWLIVMGLFETYEMVKPSKT